MKNKLALLLTGSAILGSLLLAGTAFAQTTTTPPQGGYKGMGGMHMPGVFGTVSAINGTTLTVTSKGFGQNATATTYTVDASNATVTKANAASSVSAIAVGDMVAVQGTVSGDNVTATSIHDGVMMGRGGTSGMKPGVFGTVTAVNGTTLTVTSKGFGPNSSSATATTYTVDASSATVTKDNAASSVSAIAVGDTVMVQGTVSGDSVTATSIRDGVVPQGGPGGTVIQGNGEPVVGGTVTAISGSTVTITNASNVTYTIDVSNATVEKGNATSSVSDIAVGDNVVVQGTVNGTAVTASSVIDSGASSTNSSGGMAGIGHKLGGFVGAIGGFFQHIFGFF